MTILNSLIQNECERDEDPRTEKVSSDFAVVLEDFLDEEVVDRFGVAIGTLACFWRSVSGRLVFLGIKLEGQKHVCVVPGRRSQLDDRHACIRLGFDAADIESAPQFDSARELDPTLERIVYEHFQLAETPPHGGPRHYSAVSAGTGEESCVTPNGCASPVPGPPAVPAQPEPAETLPNPADPISSETSTTQTNENTSMNKLEIKGDWNILKGKLKQKWATLTDDDLQYVAGKEEELIGRIQKRTGEIRESVEKAFHESN